MSSVESSDPTYNSIISQTSNEDDDEPDELLDDVDAITDDDEDSLKSGINLNADNYRLCEDKAAHDALLGKADAYLVKKTLTAKEAPHLDTKSLIAKLDDVAKTIDLDVSTILAEQIKDQLLGTVLGTAT